MKSIIKRILKLLTSVSLLAVIAITVFLYTQSHPRQGPMAGSGLEGDEIRFQATVEPLAHTVEIKGKSSYVKETIVYAPFSAEVKNWFVDDGVEVRVNDPLFELEADKLKNEIALAEARILQQQLELRLLEAGNERLRDDFDGDSTWQSYVSKEEQKLQKQLKQTEIEIARAALADSRERLARAVYPSEVDGIFLFVGENKPQSLEQDKPVGKIVDLSQLELVSEVGEFEVFRIREGMEVEVKIDALPDKVIDGRVQRISKFAKSGTEQQSGEAKFEITVSLEPDPDLIAGLNLTGKIITDRRDQALVVPTIAVMREDGGAYVYVEGENGVEKRSIKIGIETADKTEVLEGLAEGDTVVLR